MAYFVRIGFCSVDGLKVRFGYVRLEQSACQTIFSNKWLRACRGGFRVRHVVWVRSVEGVEFWEKIGPRTIESRVYI